MKNKGTWPYGSDLYISGQNLVDAINSLENNKLAYAIISHLRKVKLYSTVEEIAAAIGYTKQDVEASLNDLSLLKFNGQVLIKSRCIRHLTYISKEQSSYSFLYVYGLMKLDEDEVIAFDDTLRRLELNQDE